MQGEWQRLDTIVFLTDRKLFAKSFLLCLTLRCFMPTGNCWRRVSYGNETQWCFLSPGNDSTGDFSALLPTLKMTIKGTRHSVISSGAACRNGSSGIGTIETLSREISRLHAFCAIAERIQGFQPSKWQGQVLPLVFHAGRKLFDMRFRGSASDPRNDREKETPLCFTPTGNYWQKVS